MLRYRKIHAEDGRGFVLRCFNMKRAMQSGIWIALMSAVTGATPLPIVFKGNSDSCQASIWTA